MTLQATSPLLLGHRHTYPSPSHSRSPWHSSSYYRWPPHLEQYSLLTCQEDCWSCVRGEYEAQRCYQQEGCNWGALDFVEGSARGYPTCTWARRCSPFELIIVDQSRVECEVCSYCPGLFSRVNLRWRWAVKLRRVEYCLFDVSHKRGLRLALYLAMLISEDRPQWHTR